MCVCIKCVFKFFVVFVLGAMSVSVCACVCVCECTYIMYMHVTMKYVCLRELRRE